MAVTLGLSDLGARDVAIEPGRASWIAGRVLFVRLVGVLAVGLALFLAALAGEGSLAPLVIATSLMSLATASSSEWILRGTERLGLLGIADFLGGTAVTIGCVLACHHPCDLVVRYRGVCRWRGGDRRRVLGSDRTVHLSSIWGPRAKRSTAAVLADWDFLHSRLRVLRKRRHHHSGGDSIRAEAGLYTAAYRLFLAANIAGLAAAYSQLPILSRAVARGDDGEASISFRQILVLLACYGSAVVGVVSVGGRVILQTLYGSRYAGMAPVLVVLCMGVAWYAVGFPAGYTLIARGKNKGFLAGSATAACVNLTLDVILIPPFGPIGAAIATFGAFLAGALVWMYAHEMLDRPGLLMVGALTVVSCGGIIGLLIPTARLPIGLVTIAGSLLFAVRAWHRVSIFQRS